MESLYFVLTWLCHRNCPHCYEERFHPYYGDERNKLVAEAQRNVPCIIENLPDSMTYDDGQRGRIILAGGEILLEAVRESVLYPALRQLTAKYAASGGVDLIIQTTGDLVTPKIIGELMERGVTTISVSGIDSFHDGMEGLQPKLTDMFQAAGLQPQQYQFFGATPEQWIGKLWPRGRAQANELSTADISENFCNRWSGGLNFLERTRKGSEVSIDPEGNVYPCCAKTKLALGNLLESKLEAILESKRGNPVYEAINAGMPQNMGLQHGWSVEKFLEMSKQTLPSGREYANLCIGCDAFHEQVLQPNLVQISVQISA